MKTKENGRTLDTLTRGHAAMITAVECSDAALRNHILDMGLTPGVELALIKTAPMGDPLEIRVRGYELTIRKADAAKIKITNIHKLPEKKLPSVQSKTIFTPIEHSGKGELHEEKTVKKQNLRLALAGNQNSGKTTLFNRLTGAHQRIGNFPGVTVDKAEGQITGRPEAMLTDLPGIYSLSPYSTEEIVSRNYLLQSKPDAIINIVDATNIERNLFLTTQLIELNVPMVIALNMMDEVTGSGGSIDVNGLEEALGVPVIPISAAKGQGIEELVEHAVNVAKYEEKPERIDFCSNTQDRSGAVHRCIHSITHLIEDHAKEAGLPVRFAASKLTEGDHLILESLSLDENEKEAVEHLIGQMETESSLDRAAALADMRFFFIEKLCRSFVTRPAESEEYRRSLNIDKVLTGKYTALPAFLAIMAFIFYLTFGPVGTFFSDLIEKFITWLCGVTDAGLTAYGLNHIVKTLITDGIFAGVGSVLSFLPMIIILFLCLSILEDSGYMARVAFIMDKMLRRIGLSGRSFVPMIIGFGCSVPAIMASRTMPSERDRKMTVLLIPFMSCSAKLPVYALFTAAFFKEHQVLVMISLYITGIIIGILFAFFLKFFIYKGDAVPFVMEMPNYRMPSFLNVSRLIYEKAKGFITRAFTIIFAASIVIWFLQTFDTRLNPVTDTSGSILAALGGLFSPVFAPLGMNDWRISTAFITGFIAKESVISTLTVLTGNVDNLKTLLTPLTAFAFLVFTLLYTPCVAAIATVKRELGNKYMLSIIFVQTFIAWLVALCVYNSGKLIL